MGKSEKFESWFRTAMASVYMLAEDNEELARKIAQPLGYIYREFPLKFHIEVECNPVRIIFTDDNGFEAERPITDITDKLVTDIMEVMNEYASR